MAGTAPLAIPTLVMQLHGHHVVLKHLRRESRKRRCQSRLGLGCCVILKCRGSTHRYVPSLSMGCRLLKASITAVAPYGATAGGRCPPTPLAPAKTIHDFVPCPCDCHHRLEVL